MIDFAVGNEDLRGARLAVGPCVGQRPLGKLQETIKKDKAWQKAA